MGFSRQEYWRVLPLPSPGDLPNPGIEPRSPALRVDSLPAEPQGKLTNAGMGSLSLLPEDLPDPGIQLGSPALQVDSIWTELPGKTSQIFFYKKKTAWGAAFFIASTRGHTEVLF